MNLLKLKKIWRLKNSMYKLLLVSILWLGAGCSVIKSSAPTLPIAPPTTPVPPTDTILTVTNTTVDTGILDNEAPDTGDPDYQTDVQTGSETDAQAGDVTKPIKTGTSVITSPQLPIILASESRREKSIALRSGLFYSLKEVEKVQKWKVPQARVTVSVPVMTYPSDSSKAGSFNAQLNSRIESEIDDFLAAALATNGGRLNPGSPEHYLEIDTDIDTANSKLISLTITVNSYYSGSAHPNQSSRHFNFDIGLQKVLGLDELFINGKKYLPHFSALVIEAIKDQRGSEYDLQWLNTGAGPKIENYHTVTVLPQGLRVQFDPYDIDAYAVGSTEVLVLYGDLAGYIAPNIPAQAQ